MSWGPPRDLRGSPGNPLGIPWEPLGTPCGSPGDPPKPVNYDVWIPADLHNNQQFTSSKSKHSEINIWKPQNTKQRQFQNLITDPSKIQLLKSSAPPIIQVLKLHKCNYWNFKKIIFERSSSESIIMSWWFQNFNDWVFECLFWVSEEIGKIKSPQALIL